MTVCQNLTTVISVAFHTVGVDGCVSVGCIRAPESFSTRICYSGCKFATGEFHLFTGILWCVCLASCFLFVKIKDDKLMLDFGMPIFMRSNIDLHRKDKMQCVRIRSCPPWLGSQKMQKSYKSTLEYFLVT